MRMHTEEGPDAAKPSEKGEPVKPGAEARPDSSIIQKYRGLKSKLKYLIYEHRCFEHELNRAQTKLVELSRDKTVLLDELLHYEPVSGEDEELTDASGDEAGPVYKPVPPRKQVGEGSKSPQPPASGGSSKPSQLTKQGIAKASAIINSVSNNIAAKVTKTGTKRQARTVAKPGTAGGGAATKISKVVSRVRQNNPPHSEGGAVTGGVAVPNSVSHGGGASNKKLVVSYPINSIAADAPSSTAASASSFYSSKTTSLAPPPTTSSRNKTTTTTKAVKRPIPALTKAQTHQPPPPPSTTSSSQSSSTLLVSSMGSVHVTTINASPSASSSSSKPPPPPLIPSLIPDSDPGDSKGRANDGRSSSTSSTSSSSSSNSDSGSGSDVSSGSEDEAMETDAHNQSGGGSRGGGGGNNRKGGPVQIVSTVKSSSNLPRPKAILSPIKMAPTLLVSGMTTGGGGVPATPPGQVMVISPQPAFASWTTQSQPAVVDMGSPISGAAEGAPGMVGFLPTLTSPLSSPSPSSNVLPFSSSLNRPGSAGGSGSAFQVFSPKHHHHHHTTTPPNSTPSSATATTTSSLSQHTSPLSLQAPKLLPTTTNSSTNSSSASV